MTMRVTYYALRPTKVGYDTRKPGDLIPEAAEWPYLSGYVNDGHIAPVLVATLPQEVQDMLAQWELSRTGTPQTPAEAAGEPNPDEAADPDEDDEPGEEVDEPAAEVEETKEPQSGRKKVSR